MYTSDALSTIRNSLISIMLEAIEWGWDMHNSRIQMVPIYDGDCYSLVFIYPNNNYTPLYNCTATEFTETQLHQIEATAMEFFDDLLKGRVAEHSLESLYNYTPRHVIPVAQCYIQGLGQVRDLNQNRVVFVYEETEDRRENTFVYNIYLTLGVNVHDVKCPVGELRTEEKLFGIEVEGLMSYLQRLLYRLYN